VYAAGNCADPPGSGTDRGRRGRQRRSGHQRAIERRRCRPRNRRVVTRGLQRVRRRVTAPPAQRGRRPVRALPDPDRLPCHRSSGDRGRRDGRRPGERVSPRAPASRRSPGRNRLRR
jgi:hypothetical protein